jgi:hypothetical protein
MGTDAEGSLVWMDATLNLADSLSDGRNGLGKENYHIHKADIKCRGGGFFRRHYSMAGSLISCYCRLYWNIGSCSLSIE